MPYIILFILLYSSVFAQKSNALNYAELDSLLNLTYENGDYEKALSYVDIAKEKAKAEFGTQDTIYATYLVWGGFLNDYLGQYAEAEQFYLEAKAIQSKVLGKLHPDYANNINNLAALYKTMGKYIKAEPLYLEAKGIFEKIFGKEHPDYASSLNNLAVLYHDMGWYAKTEALYLEAKNIEAKTLGKDDPAYATSLNNLAHLYHEMGNYAQAEPLYLESIAILSRTIGKEHPFYATCLNGLATLYYQLGNYAQAEPLYLESNAIQFKRMGKEHPSYANGLSNLANLYKDIHRTAEAEALMLEAKGIYAKSLGTEHSDYGNILNKLAILYQSDKQYQKAEKLFQEANSIQAKKFGKIHRLYALGITNLATLYKETGRYSESEKLYLEAKDIFEKSLGKEHPSYANNLNSLAGLYLNMEQLENAYRYCLASIDANSSQIDSNFGDWTKLDQFDYYSNYYINISIQKLLHILQAQFETTGDKTKLEMKYQLAETAMRLNERIRNGLSTEGDKLTSLNINTVFVEQAIQTALKLDNKTYQEAAFSFAELNKSILLADALKGNRARALGDLPDTLVDKELVLQNQVSELKKQTYEAKTPEAKAQVHQELNALNLEVNAFLKSLQNKYPKYHHLKYENITPKAADIQAIIDDETALVEYFLTNEIIYLFVITKSEVKLHALPVKMETLKEKIKTLRNALSNYSFVVKEEEKAYKDYTETAYWFYENLLKLGIQNLKVETLNIITDGELGHLPFETFLVDVAPQKKDYKNLHYLAKDYNISYNYSATLFKENLNTKKQTNNGQMLACASAYPAVDASLASLRLPYFYKLRTLLEPLPAAQKEIAALAENFQGDFLWNDSTNERFFKENAQKYSIIHLAMHGILDQKQPMLSSLAFTENRDSVEDNFLQAFEISRLKLNADLVVLSACETGYGKFTQGEGVVSIARSFMYAGVPSLVVSLWQVNDASTALIMKAFYSNLAAGMSKDAALRKAKMDYVQKAEGILAHPAFWSPFIQMGDSRPIRVETQCIASLPVWTIIGLILLVVSTVIFFRYKAKQK